MNLRPIAAATVLVLLSGCAINNQVGVSALFQSLPDAIKARVSTDLQSTAANLDKGVADNILLPTDPLPKCVHSFNRQIGIEGPPLDIQSFTPDVTGIASFGSAAYLSLAKIRQLQRTGIQVTATCASLLGTVNLQAMADALSGGRIPVVVIPDPPDDGLLAAPPGSPAK